MPGNASTPSENRELRYIVYYCCGQHRLTIHPSSVCVCVSEATMGWCARRMLLATAVLSCSLMGLSSGCVAEPGSSSSHNKPAVRSKLPAVASGLKGRTTVVVVGGVGGGGGGGGSSLSLLGAVGSRERRLFETATTLRGGSLAEKIPVLDAASSALAAISVPVTAIAWTGGPTLFAQVRVDLI